MRQNESKCIVTCHKAQMDDSTFKTPISWGMQGQIDLGLPCPSRRRRPVNDNTRRTQVTTLPAQTRNNPTHKPGEIQPVSMNLPTNDTDT